MTYRKLTLSLLLILATALVACGDSDEEPERELTAIDNLPAESRLLANSSGVAPYEGTAEQFLSILPFEPLLPEVVAGERALRWATIIPSMPGAGKNDPDATLVLLYAGDAAVEAGAPTDTIEITQHMRPMIDLSGVGADIVDVGGAEATALAFEGSTAIQLLWSDCGLTHTISSSVITREEAIAIGESMTDGCEDPTEE